MVTATVLRRKHPAQFGRRAGALSLEGQRRTSLADDLRLFATFFLGGLTFMSVYLA